MISVIVYGRNDSYGYNLAKRAAISLNCIAQLLDDPDDEIIFVDCNTPDDIPTFPESIADTLTTKAKQVLRVLRLRPDQFERGKNGTKFKVLEPLCRNIALRRSNPVNRWVLNTNTDMVFTPLEDGMSLSRITSDLPDGFYELPRFEMPETLWETTDRRDPDSIIKLFRYWGLRLHIDEILTASEEILFDGPGDFQLAVRSQLFDIGGINEQMVSGWHVDINLCKRMWLLNGGPKTILDQIYAFHCDHTRIQTVYHIAGKSTANSMDDFFHNVTSPYIPEQADTWGMPTEKIEEIHLDCGYEFRIPHALEKLLPGMDEPIAKCIVGGNFYDTALYYDDYHAFPYLADIVANLPPNSNMGYMGNNPKILKLLSEYRHLLNHSGCINYHIPILEWGGVKADKLPGNCRGSDLAGVATSDSLVLDFSMKNFPYRIVDGLQVPERCKQVEEFVRAMAAETIALARVEKDRTDKDELLRHFIFVGCHGTSFDVLIKSLFSCALTPPGTCIRNGTLSAEAFSTHVVVPFHYYVLGFTKHDYAEWISKRICKPISLEEFIRLDKLFNSFVMSTDKQQAMKAFDSLASSDAGKARLLMQVEIYEIDGLGEQACALSNFIHNYEIQHIARI